MKQHPLCSLVLLTLCLALQPLRLRAGEADAVVPRDTVWADSATLGRVHLQRIAPDDTLRHIKPNGIKPVLESLAINFGVWGWDHFVTDRAWADIDIHSVRRNLKNEWVLDHDSFSGNQFSHPFHGSMFYSAARYHGQSYYTAALYPLVGSMVWEYFCETNLPAYNDFLSTGIGGSAIGEALYRTADLAFDNSKRGAARVIRELVGSVLSPGRGIHRLFSGESWHVSAQRGKMVEPEPFQFDIGLGERLMTEYRHEGRHKQVAFVDFTLRYGERFHYDEKQKPFDHFSLHLLTNISEGNPTLSDADIRGRIVGRSFDTQKGWQMDLALYQNFRYVDNYGDKDDISAGDFPLFAEAASFGAGFYTEKRGRRLSFSNDFSLNGVGFGAVANEYYDARRYNFASGFSLRNTVALSIHHVARLSCDAYFGRFYSPKGGRDPHVDGDYYWGARGHASILMVRSQLQVPLWHYTSLNLQHLFWYRRSQYDYYPDRHAKSSELSFGLVHSI